MKKKAQNIIEFVFIFPLLFLIILIIIEVAMYWRAVSTVQNIAIKASANAALQPITSNMTVVMPYNNTDCTSSACSNFPLAKAIDVVKSSQGLLGLGQLNYSCTTKTSSNANDYNGKPPYAFYDCQSTETYNSQPIMELTMDTRDVQNRGIITQLTFLYHTFILSAKIPLPDGTALTIIPESIPISSTKIIANPEL